MQSVRISVLVLLVGLVAGGAWAQPNPGATSPPKSTPPKNETPKADAPKNTAKPASGSLEEMLATALRNNPDIRVAEAKLREAEASLNKARIQVMQQVVSLKNAVDAQKKALEMAEQSHKRIIELRKSNVVPEAEVQQSEALLAKAKAELAKLDADLAIPLGRLPGKYDGVDIGTNTTIIQGLSVNDSTWMDWNNVLNLNQQNGPWLVPGQLAPQAQWNWNPSTTNILRLQPFITNWPDGTSNTLMGTLRVNQSFPYAPPATAISNAGTIAEKIRAALDRPLKIEKAIDAPAKEIVNILHEKGAKEILFRVLESDSAEERVQLMAAELPLGAWLQAVEDSLPGAKFCVREYGILFVPRNRAPKDAIGAVEFWRHAKAEKAKETEKVSTPPKAK